ncbi:MAG: response regulator transcription factor [Clostridia bacterium]|nr:response regulator transcription factor [Clostridia bacterium]
MIYIVEDDQSIREIELFALENSGYEARGFENARAFWQAAEERLPELILLDIMLNGEDGLTVLRKLRERTETRRIPVILVTARGEEIDRVKGLNAGADDYICKPFGVMEMIARVKALLRRTQEADADILRCGRVTLDTRRRMMYVDGRAVELTYKEFELLRLLMKNEGVVISREVIMERVWDCSAEVETRTIDVHIRTLRQKLGGEGAMIRTIRNVGYMAEAMT